MIKHGKIYFSWLILLVLFPLDISSQVRTTIVENQKGFLKVVENHNSEFSKTVEIERPNVESKLKEDELNSSGIARYAIEVETDLTVVDGTFSLGKNFTNWKIKIVAKNATSINVILRDVVLPKGAQIYMYSLDKRMISGPILSQNLFKGKYMSDMLYGDELIIEVIIPNKSNYQEFSISIPKIMYGIKSNNYVSQTRAYGDSKPCNNDINCSVGNGWEDVRDGVALVFTPYGTTCSGSLVTDQCFSGRPYFLTAFHCFDGNNNGSFSNNERDKFEDSSYRFLYDNEDCDGTIEPTSWLSISGAEFRSGWSKTDFALAELSSSPAGISPNVVNSGNVSTFAVGCIHHPKGDVKKISIDFDPLQSNTNFWIVEDWDDGIVEFGSSGGPLFDANHRIIGVVSAGNAAVDCASLTGGSTLDNGTYGRMDVSWNGGGQPTNSLQPWLGNSIPPDVNIPNNIIDSLFDISGPSVLCEGDQRTFCVSPSSGLSGMTWSVEPTDFFSSNTAGSGNCATLKVKDDYLGNGMATLTFSGNFPVYGTCGISSTITKEIWIGKPPKPRLDLPDCFNPMINIYILG